MSDLEPIRSSLNQLFDARRQSEVRIAVIENDLGDLKKFLEHGLGDQLASQILAIIKPQLEEHRAENRELGKQKDAERKAEMERQSRQTKVLLSIVGAVVSIIGILAPLILGR